MTLDFPTFRTVTHKFLFFISHSTYGIFVIAAQTVSDNSVPPKLAKPLSSVVQPYLSYSPSKARPLEFTRCNHSVCVCVFMFVLLPQYKPLLFATSIYLPSTNSLLIRCKHRFQTIFSKHMSDYSISMHETEHFNDFPLHLGQKLKSFE